MGSHRTISAPGCHSRLHSAIPIGESPFTDLDGQGVGGLFPQADVVQIVNVLNDVKRNAAA